MHAFLGRGPTLLMSVTDCSSVGYCQLKDFGSFLMWCDWTHQVFGPAAVFVGSLLNASFLGVMGFINQQK